MSISTSSPSSLSNFFSSLVNIPRSLFTTVGHPQLLVILRHPRESDDNGIRSGCCLPVKDACTILFTDPATNDCVVNSVHFCIKLTDHDSGVEHAYLSLSITIKKVLHRTIVVRASPGHSHFEVYNRPFVSSRVLGSLTFAHALPLVKIMRLFRAIGHLAPNGDDSIEEGELQSIWFAASLFTACRELWPHTYHKVVGADVNICDRTVRELVAEVNLADRIRENIETLRMEVDNERRARLAAEAKLALLERMLTQEAQPAVHKE